MSSVLHPVGPEPSPTYWTRRILVIAAVVVVLVVLIAFIKSVSGTSTVQANPSAPASVPPAASTPTPTPSSSPTPTPTPSAAVTPSASATPAVTSSAPATPSAGAKPSASAKPAGPVACDAADLRTTLRGKQSLKPKQPDRFALSVINGGAQPCVLALTGSVFELKIYSGTDRIWSTADCSTAVKKQTKTLAPQQALEWTQTWDGRRSKSDCRQRPEVPQTGTYFATAQLKGAKPVQIRVVLRG
ncbi:MAG: hypothetical protein JWP61_373 [Friedmanniella sp.]|nr:hypothetical protein [Friedmanniella sp.]